MITKSALSLLTLQLKLACVLNAVPYQWDNTAKILIHTKSNSRLAIFHFSVWAEWIYTGFKAVRLFYAFRHASSFAVIVHAGWLARDVLLSAFHLTSIMRRAEVPEFFNKMLKFDQKDLSEFAKKQKLEHEPIGKDWCSVYHLQCSLPVSASFPLFLALFAWILAPLPQFIASLFSPDGATHPELWVKVACLILELWIGYTSWFACYFYTSTLFCVIQSLRYTLRLLSLPPQPEVDYTESINRSKKLYRVLQILNNYLNDCWRSIIAPAQQCADLIMGVTYTCGFIKFSHTLGFVTLFCFIYQVIAVAGCTSSTYSIAGRLPRWSERVFLRWKRLDFERIILKGPQKPQKEKTDEDKGNHSIVHLQGQTDFALNEIGVVATSDPTEIMAQGVCVSRGSVQRKQMTAFIRSCRPLHMKTAFFFTVTRQYGLGWFSWYAENTVSLTLAFKDK